MIEHVEKVHPAEFSNAISVVLYMLGESINAVLVREMYVEKYRVKENVTWGNQSIPPEGKTRLSIYGNQRIHVYVQIEKQRPIQNPNVLFTNRHKNIASLQYPVFKAH